MEPIKQTDTFALFADGTLKTKNPELLPNQTTVTQKDIYYLCGLNPKSFDAACVWDYGLATCWSES